MSNDEDNEAAEAEPDGNQYGHSGEVTSRQSNVMLERLKTAPGTQEHTNKQTNKHFRLVRMPFGFSRNVVHRLSQGCVFVFFN